MDYGTWKVIDRHTGNTITTGDRGTCERVARMNPSNYAVVPA